MIRFSIAAAVIVMASQVMAADSQGRATVVDGDTIIVEGVQERIRLHAVDAPENGQPCIDAAGKKYLCGGDSAEALAQIIGRNGRVSCKKEDTDRYGRHVATCQVNGVDIGRELVRQGWAVEYPQYSDGRYTADEARAKALKLGMWQGQFDMPWEWRKQKRNPGPKPMGLMSQALTPTTKLAAATRRSCKAVSSCREAVIMWCGGYHHADRDGDGIPCENVCKTLAQVEEIKAEIGCTK